MKRINVTFYDETFAELEARAKNNGSNSIAHEIRELVDLGLKVEAAAQENNAVDTDASLLKIIEMLKQNLTWSLETRLLARYLVESMPAVERDNQATILEKYKEKAVHFVEGMLHENVK